RSTSRAANQFELVINIKTANTLGPTVPPSIQLSVIRYGAGRDSAQIRREIRFLEPIGEHVRVRQCNFDPGPQCLARFFLTLSPNGQERRSRGGFCGTTARQPGRSPGRRFSASAPKRETWTTSAIPAAWRRRRRERGLRASKASMVVIYTESERAAAS